MRILVTFKGGAENERAHIRTLDMEQPEYERLKSDFLSYLNGSALASRGASYYYLDIDTSQSRELIVRFDDILYMECIIQVSAQDNRAAARSGTTGPLLSRIASTGTGET